MASPAPPQLGFLAIYNPSLGRAADGAADDGAEDEQIIYYASLETLARQQQQQQQKHPRGRRGQPEPAAVSPAERHQRLRQVGLAQGMIEFGAGFSAGAAVDSVETERARILMHELEPGWWILASVDLGRVPLPPRLPASPSAADPHPSDQRQQQQQQKFEYTSRDLKPARLLLQDLLRAHSIFLLHHGSSLSSLFARSRSRAWFVGLLVRYWDLFLPTWSVVLAGNPARDVLGGINVAASGELGVGVGEEHRGSGEREVLEGLVGRVEGLVDLIVSRFGRGGRDTDDEDGGGGGGGNGNGSGNGNDQGPAWLGIGREPGAEDGAVFLGVGALSRKSLQDVAHWIEDLYTWGENAYGVIDSPTPTWRRRRRGAPKENPRPEIAPANQAATATDGTAKPGEAVSAPSSEDSVPLASDPDPDPDGDPDPDAKSLHDGHHMDRLVSYLRLGYGTYWTLGGGGAGPESSSSSPAASSLDTPDRGSHRHRHRHRVSPPGRGDAEGGRYLIGLMGDIEEPTPRLPSPPPAGSDREGERQRQRLALPRSDSRIMLRTVHVELEAEARDRPEAETGRDLGNQPEGSGGGADDEDDDAESLLSGPSPALVDAAPGFGTHGRNKAKELRVVVYVNQPFIFAFLFSARTVSLELDATYRSLHSQLVPLRRPLLASTAYRPARPEPAADHGAKGGGGGGGGSGGEVYDLIWDPRTRAVHCTVPNIPPPGPPGLPGPAAPWPPSPWTRAEAMNTHGHLLALLAATRSGTSDQDLERTFKTGRGWWIVWTRLLEEPARRPSHAAAAADLTRLQEADEQENVHDGSRKDDDKSTGSDSDDNKIGDGQGRSSPAAAAAPASPAAVHKEVFLLRRATDHTASRMASMTGALGEMTGVSSSSPSSPANGGGDGAGGLGRGIGVDMRSYIDALLQHV